MSVQQNQGIKGTVVDATGETLIGASVKVAGTTNGSVTDIDGNFTLNCSWNNARSELHRLQDNDCESC